MKNSQLPQLQRPADKVIERIRAAKVVTTPAIIARALMRLCRSTEYVFIGAPLSLGEIATVRPSRSNQVSSPIVSGWAP